jgi:probable HAF family extracellular repeat protein
MTDIDPFIGEFSESSAHGVNNLGQVVGQYLVQDQSSHHAFLFSAGTFRDIGVPESPETVAFAINDRAQIVGVTLVPYEDVCFDSTQGASVTCTNYMQHAFLYETGGLLDLNASIPADSGWELEWAFDINNDGQIVGYGLVNDKFRAFVLTPAVSSKQCKKGAWKQFVGFDSQGDCVQFVISK